jgi:MoxR-like ATPase
MIRQKPVGEIIVPSDLQITDELYETWQNEIHNIAIPDNVCSAVSFIRKRLKEESTKEGNKDMDFYVSDRRWKKCFRIMQTAAFLNGRNAIDLTDVPILFHCLWNTVDVIPTIIDIVASSLTADIDRQMEKSQKEIDLAIKKKSQPVKKEENTHNLPEQFTLVSYFYYSIRNFPQGKCLFYKADYNHVEVDKVSDGILYHDEQKRAWIVHAIYTGAPFDYKVRNVQNVRRVKLQKCNGGIIIDNTPYAFERRMPLSMASLASDSGQGLFTDEIFAEPSVADTALSTLQENIAPALTNLQTLFAQSMHLFLSDDDKKIVKKYLVQCEKRMKEMEVKIKNTQQLL